MTNSSAIHSVVSVSTPTVSANTFDLGGSQIVVGHDIPLVPLGERAVTVDDSGGGGTRAQSLPASLRSANRGLGERVRAVVSAIQRERSADH